LCFKTIIGDFFNENTSSHQKYKKPLIEIVPLNMPWEQEKQQLFFSICCYQQGSKYKNQFSNYIVSNNNNVVLSTDGFKINV
jgi:hypothetical protein